MEEIKLKPVVSSFAFRDGEKFQIIVDQPTCGRWFAIQALTATMPPGPAESVRQPDGLPVEQAAIIACQMNNEGRWQWMHLSPAAKEMLGDILFATENKAERNRWYFVAIADKRMTDAPFYL